MQTTGPFSVLDPSTWPGSVFLQVVAALLVLGLVTAFGWITGPLKWWKHGRRLREFLLMRSDFTFVYNPSMGYSKKLTFLPGGAFAAGKNENEHTWRVRKGALEILAGDGHLYSRFRLDQASGRLANTNDPDARSIFGQYLQPQHRDWRLNAPPLPGDRNANPESCSLLDVPEATDKWVTLDYPEEAGISQHLRSQGLKLVWSRADEESTRVDLKGWSVVEEPDANGNVVRFKVRDPHCGYLILLKKAVEEHQP